MSSFNVNADLVPLFRGLVTGLQPFANAQQVALNFVSKQKNLYASYNPAEVLAEVTVLLSRIITFTPQSYSVSISIGFNCNSNQGIILTIENTGVDLSRVVEILSTVRHGLELEKLQNGTRFVIQIPIIEEGGLQGNIRCNGPLTPKKYPFYFSAVSKRLASHFSKSKNLEMATWDRNPNDGIFLKKVNALIQSQMDNPEFKVCALADAMALSRSQLFRKMKAMTRMSPQKYLRYLRLERAKKMLQSTSEDTNVSEVCYKTGFASQSHFTRAFQKEFGFKPSEIR